MEILYLVFHQKKSNSEFFLLVFFLVCVILSVILSRWVFVSRFHAKFSLFHRASYDELSIANSSREKCPQRTCYLYIQYIRIYHSNSALGVCSTLPYKNNPPRRSISDTHVKNMIFFSSMQISEAKCLLLSCIHFSIWTIFPLFTINFHIFFVCR